MKKLVALMLTLAMLLGLGAGAVAEGTDPYTGIAYAQDTEYTYLYGSEITSLNYLATSVSQNQKSLANFIDTLIEYDNLGNIVPCLATSWEVSDDGMDYTFHIREGVNWFTADGEVYGPVTANDFVYAARLCSDAKFDSDMADMVKSYLVNSAELYAASADAEKRDTLDFSTVGAEATDDYTLVYHLKQPCPYFLTLLTYGCYLPVNGEYYESLEIENPEPTINDSGEEEYVTNEFGTDYDKILYCGAYLCESWLPQEEYIWVKNENYWDAEHVYIDRIAGQYNAQADAIAPEMFLRGEIDACNVTTNILDDWLKGDNANYVHLARKEATVMYMLFNFNPYFDDEAAGANYKIAVNNKNFRMSIVYGLNKAYSISAYDPYNAESLVINTMVPADFAFADGKDYTEYGDLPELSKGFYDPDEAVAFRDAAKEELTAAGATFPISIPVYYNPTTVNMDESFQLIEKQLEELLGNDYIDITVNAGPSTNFIREIRRRGVWGLFEAGWSPDYIDPATYFEPFSYGWTFGSQEYIEGDEYKTGYVYTAEDNGKIVFIDESMVDKPQMVFNSLMEAAYAETDLAKRYELFAKCEAYALTEGLLMPYRQFNGGYIASNIAMFEVQNAMAGICSYRYKGVHLLEKSYSMEEYETALAAWEAEKVAE